MANDFGVNLRRLHDLRDASFTFYGGRFNSGLDVMSFSPLRLRPAFAFRYTRSQMPGARRGFCCRSLFAQT